MTQGGCSGACHGCGAAGKEAGCAGHGCGACCGQGELILCPEEVKILLTLGQLAFLPVITKYQNGEPYMVPIPEDAARFSHNFSDMIVSLERKRLISIDADLAIQNANYGEEPSARFRCGSLALTLQGQEVLDWISPDETLYE